jgi:NADH-quinone oxidoreductase subunit F
MDRMLLESYPYRVLEGMLIASLAVGAHEGIIYIRAEYPLAVRRVNAAIEQCEKSGFLGEDILGSGHALHVRVMEAAGAFVCGEETALLASIEGRRGMPAFRPPFPATRGLHECPTLVNNVETYALVPWIVRNGPDAFAAFGTDKSKGTKVFSLTGKILRGGLIEVPMGVTIRQIVQQIGGGPPDGRAFKAVQVGGPSGGCIPASLADTPVDFEALAGVGAMMGSGGLVVLDDSDCMVEIARYFIEFMQHESCGKCTPCRVGTTRMLEILTLLCEGKASLGDLEQLESIAQSVKELSLCGLGKTAPNPVLTTLRYFRDEFVAHVEGRCPAHACRKMITYTITHDCIGCTKCAQECPVDAIEMKPYQLHTIDDALCTRCDACRAVCPVNAVIVD